MVKRIITFLLALVMVLGAIPAMPAYATEVEVISAPKETAEAVEATTEAAEVITEATEETVEGITDTVEAAAEQTKTEEDPANNWFVDEYGTYHFNNFDGLKYLLQMDFNFANQYETAVISYASSEDLVITENITIPKQLTVTVGQIGFNKAANFIVAEGVTVTNKGSWAGAYLTVNGKWINEGYCAFDHVLQINGKFLNYDMIYLNVAGEIKGTENLSFEKDSAYVQKDYLAYTMEDFLEDVEAANVLPEQWRASITLMMEEDLTLNQSIAIPSNGRFTISDQFAPEQTATLTLTEGCKILVNKNATASVSANLHIDGTLENNGRMEQYGKNVVSFGQTGSYVTNGTWEVSPEYNSGDQLEDLVKGLDFSQYSVKENKYNWEIKNKATFTKLDKPTKVTATANEKLGLPALSWKTVENAESYDIYRSTKKSSGFTKIANKEGTYFVDDSAKVGKKYYYKIKAVAGDITSSYSSVVSATCQCAQPVVEVSITTSSGKAKLKWGKVVGAEKYYVYRSTKKTSGFEKIKSTTKAYYTDSSAKVGTTYYYKVKAIADDGNSEYSAYVKAKRICAQPDLTVKRNSTTGQPNLSWDKVSGAKEYKIYRNIPNTDGEFELIKTVSSKTTSYKETKALPGLVYYYRVDVVGSKSGTNSVAEEPVDCLVTCAKPSISVKNDAATGDPVITWKTVKYAVHYRVQRSTKSSSGFQDLDIAFETSFQDTTASTGKKYYYRVIAVTEGGESGSASSAKSVYSKIAAPVAEVALSGKKPKVTWAKVDGVQKYEVYRATSKSGKYTKVKTTTGASYTDKSAKKGKTYYYKVKAVASSSSYNSAYSAVVKMKSK